MQKAKIATLLAWCMLGACDWFDRGAKCEEGSQRCADQKLQTCAAKTQSVGAQPVFEWHNTSSCALQGLVCREDDGFAACVMPSAGEDAATRASEAGVGGMPPTGANTTFRDTPLRASTWMRLDVVRTDGAFALNKALERDLDFVPASPPVGEFALTSYDAAGTPLAAALVAVSDSGTTSGWLPTSKAAAVRLVGRDGKAAAAELVLDSAPSPSAARKLQALGDVLPPTLLVTKPLTSVLGLGVAGSTLVSVSPSPALLEGVATALGALPGFASSTLTEVAFVATSLFEAAVADRGDGGIITVDIPVLDGAVALSTAPEVFSNDDRARAQRAVGVNVQGVLVVNASADAMDFYAKQPAALRFGIVRAIASQLTRYTGKPSSPFFFGTQWAFPPDFPQAIQTLVKARLAPLLLPRETFVDAWNALHQVAVDAGFAASYLGNFAGALTPEQAIEQGFASRQGAQSAEQDFIEYAAFANAPELWSPSPCAAFHEGPAAQLKPVAFVHLAKLEALWGLGLLSAERVQSCIGDLLGSADAAGIAMFATDGVHRFDRNVQGHDEIYYHGERQLALTADLGPEGQEITAAFAVSVHGLTTGLFRLTSISKRLDPETGAGFYLSKPITYERNEATGGLLLISRSDAQRIEGHALMVVQGVKDGAAPLIGSKVLPLVLARYDVPPEEVTTASGDGASSSASPTPQPGTKLDPRVAAQVKKPVWGDAP